MAHPGGHNHDKEIRKIVEEEFSAALLSAVNGEIEFKVTPETVSTHEDDQNVGKHQEIKATVSGEVASDGGDDIVVRVKAKVLDDGEFELTDVTVANSDSASDIAGKIQSALVATTQFSADGDSGEIQVTASDAVITLKMVDEAKQDDTFTLEVEEGDATFDTPLAVDVETEQEGVAPYTRKVQVELVDDAGNRHWWFTDDVPVTIGEDTEGSGEAEVVGGTTPKMKNGFMELTVLLRGDWSGSDEDTNTLTVSEKTILGETVSEKTSVETTTEG